MSETQSMFILLLIGVVILWVIIWSFFRDRKNSRYSYMESQLRKQRGGEQIVGDYDHQIETKNSNGVIVVLLIVLAIVLWSKC